MKELEESLDEAIKGYKRIENLMGGNIEILNEHDSPILYKEKEEFKSDILRIHKELIKKYPNSHAIQRVKWIPKKKPYAEQ